MSNETPEDIIATLDEAIVRDTKLLTDHQPGTPEHKQIMESLERLHLIRHELVPDPTKVLEVQTSDKKDRLKFKDFLPMITSLAGIGTIVVFEAFGHTLTSKAAAFVSKGK